jgi:DNA sulfur modification protein DndC
MTKPIRYNRPFLELEFDQQALTQPGCCRFVQVVVRLCGVPIKQNVMLTVSFDRVRKYDHHGTPLFSAHLVKPELHDRFWLNVCGRGYPAPSIRTRWCTERLKIDSTARFILSQISKHGQILLTLGTREEESTTRRVSMRKHALPGMQLQRHSTMHQAYVYTPIADVCKDDLWQYLIQFHDTPWGDDNYDLLALYKASDGECPLVTDVSRPACGNGRMGCYVCTLVESNKSLAARIDDGEEWLLPLLAIHQFLHDTIQPDQKHRYRSLEARGTNLIELNRQGKPS